MALLFWVPMAAFCGSSPGFTGLPHSAKWAISLKTKPLLEWISSNPRHAAFFQSHCDQLEAQNKKVIGIPLRPEHFSEMTLFGLNGTSSDPSGIILNSSINPHKFLTAFRQRLLDSGQMSLRDLPEPVRSPLGLEVFMVKNELAAAQIAPGFAALTRNPQTLQLIHSALSAHNQPVSTNPYSHLPAGLAGLLIQHPQFPHSNGNFASFFVSDLSEMQRSYKLPAILARTRQMLISMAYHQKSLYLQCQLECASEEDASHAYQLALGLKAMGALILSTEPTGLTRPQSLMEGFHQGLIESMSRNTSITKPGPTRITALTQIQGPLLQKLENSLFEIVQNKLHLFEKKD